MFKESEHVFVQAVTRGIAFCMSGFDEVVRECQNNARVVLLCTAGHA